MGQQMHKIHEICLSAAEAGGHRGDILKLTKQMMGNREAVRAADTEPPGYYDYDVERVAPTYVTPLGAHNIQFDPCGAELGGRESWNSSEWAQAFPTRDLLEPLPMLALVNQDHSSEEEALAPFQVKEEPSPSPDRASSPKRSRSPAKAQPATGIQGGHKDPNAAPSSSGPRFVDRGPPMTVTRNVPMGKHSRLPVDPKAKSVANANLIVEGIRAMRSEEEPEEDQKILFINTLLAMLTDDPTLASQPERPGQMEKYHICRAYN